MYYYISYYYVLLHIIIASLLHHYYFITTSLLQIGNCVIMIPLLRVMQRVSLHYYTIITSDIISFRDRLESDLKRKNLSQVNYTRSYALETTL